MQFTSSRNKQITKTSAEAIVQGLSDEGGLFVPESIPYLPIDKIASFKNMTYCQRAYEILSLFLTDFTKEELENCISSSYTDKKFETAAIAPVYKLNDKEYFLELWHGPTCAFKDMALQILPKLLVTSMKKIGVKKDVVILVATSGDTGKAALDGFSDVEQTRILVFYPIDGVSEIQKLQMVTQEGYNVGVIAVNGNFDDAQNGVKEIFTNKDYATILDNNNFVLSSANSINWGRLVPQIVYYFSAYADMLAGNEINLGEKINVCVPTGNFGNILAAYYAKMMGLPINKLICASNKNNVLTDFINTGVYDRNRGFYSTNSPSMDILISSNLERLLYHLIDDDVKITKLFSLLNENGSYEIDKTTKVKLEEHFWAGFSTDENSLAKLKTVFKDSGYTIDTHTAVAKAVYDDYVSETGDNTPTLIVSTASPFKFSQSVIAAIDGLSATLGKDEFMLLDYLSSISNMKIPNSLAQLRGKQKFFDINCQKDNMENMVSEFLEM